MIKKTKPPKGKRFNATFPPDLLRQIKQAQVHLQTKPARGRLRSIGTMAFIRIACTQLIAQIRHGVELRDATLGSKKCKLVPDIPKGVADPNVPPMVGEPILSSTLLVGSLGKALDLKESEHATEDNPAI